MAWNLDRGKITYKRTDRGVMISHTLKIFLYFYLPTATTASLITRFKVTIVHTIVLDKQSHFGVWIGSLANRKICRHIAAFCWYTNHVDLLLDEEETQYASTTLIGSYLN